MLITIHTHETRREKVPMNTVESDARVGQMKALRAHARGGAEQLVYEDAPVPGAPTGSDGA